MSLEKATERRLLIARRWETHARWVIYGAVALMGVSWLTGRFSVALAAAFIAMPSAWLFNLRCPNCAWLVYRQFGTADAKHSKDQFLAPLHSRQLWRQPTACSKCGYPFRSTDTNLKANNAQTH